MSSSSFFDHSEFTSNEAKRLIHVVFDSRCHSYRIISHNITECVNMYTSKVRLCAILLK